MLDGPIRRADREPNSKLVEEAKRGLVNSAVELKIEA